MVALAISPPVVRLITGRPDLSLRINVILALFELFLISVIAAFLTGGRIRKLFFHLMAWTFPLAILAGLESAAIAVDLANRVAPIENNALLANIGRWPAHLMSESRWAPEIDGLKLYRPWRGDGIFINELGLRTASPTPKAPGEWRVAVTGGSSAWGFRLLDADTIAARLQGNLRRNDPEITIYNFGIEGAMLAQELALVKRFREVYAIDQVIFFTGANNAFADYLGALGTPTGFGWIAGENRGFELLKAARRLGSVLRSPSSATSSPIADLAARVVSASSLREGIAAAEGYCRAVALRCDFALQLILQMRKMPLGPEVTLARSLESIYPGIGVVTSRLYGDAIESGPRGRVHDVPDVVDRAATPLFFDVVHMTEHGNEVTAEAIAPIVLKERPR